MELKRYQERVVKEAEEYLRAVQRHREAGNRDYGSSAAWERDRKLGGYRRWENGLGLDAPRFTIKVPTGGGKTLLATQILGSLYRTILQDRNGAGLVLWVVPSSQIYRDTIRRLSDRQDMYRLMLEHAVSRRIEIWEKHEIARLSPARLRECLNILVVQLASTNRETKEQLKFFKDSGGNIVQHFPPENDYEAQRQLKERTRNLDMLVEDPNRGEHLVATSIGNLVKLCQPAVILDEGHKATSELAQKTLADFNAAAVVELSATPRVGANILCRVTGQELLNEEMIKLPLNIATSAQKKWEDVLTQARDRRLALAKLAEKHFEQAGPDRQIRPIVLVQVERTGKEQVGKNFIHAEQVREYLIQRLNVPEEAIRIKTAEDDGLEDVDLLDPGCPVQWIITKSALQEGWDCPFAYILVSLSSTGSSQNMTQLVGRVLRQPYQERTEFAELNESYIYCLHATTGEISRQVKAALEKEGYAGELDGLVVSGSADAARSERDVKILPRYKKLYGQPFAGKIYLPRFCVVHGKGAKAEYEPLDYFEHLISRVDVTKFAYGGIDWPLAEALREAKDRYYRVDLEGAVSRVEERDIDPLESDEQILGWMAASLRFTFLSQKELYEASRRIYERLLRTELTLPERLSLVKFVVLERAQRWIEEQIDAQTEAAFDKLFDNGTVQFYLECSECRFEIPPSVRLQSKGPLTPLTHDDGQQVERSLFDFVELESQNNYERAVALCLDKDEHVLWWYRNRVGTENFSIQGSRRNKIYPDFVVQRHTKGVPRHYVMVLESKGEHLQGNLDTTYKRKVAGYFNQIGKCVTWQQLGADFKDHMFCFQVLDEAQPEGREWKDILSHLLESGTCPEGVATTAQA
jgi:type III restriction enzyme